MDKAVNENRLYIRRQIFAHDNIHLNIQDFRLMKGIFRNSIKIFIASKHQGKNNVCLYVWHLEDECIRGSDVKLEPTYLPCLNYYKKAPNESLDWIFDRSLILSEENTQIIECWD